jgi:two-component system, LytTR family, response regulator
MLKSIIIEDEENAANLLEGMLHDIDPTILVLQKCRDLANGVKCIKKYNPDIVFLDIELPVYSGIQILDFFDKEDITFHIIFTTASSEYAVKAFEMSAIDYLMKPIQEEQLKTSIQKAFSKTPNVKADIFPILKENLDYIGNKKLVVPIANGFEILNISDISYLKAEGSYTLIFLGSSASILISKNLKHLESLLQGADNFVRIHRSFVANIDFARRILRKDGGTLYMKNNIELPVAEDKMELVLKMLNKI